MADRVIQRNDTAARWQSINPILATGEIGIEIDGAKGYKIGDGKTRWNDLPYPANPTNVVQEVGSNENAVMSQKAVSEKLSELGSEVGNVKGVLQSQKDEYIPLKLNSGDEYTLNITSLNINGVTGLYIRLASQKSSNTAISVGISANSSGSYKFLVPSNFDCNYLYVVPEGSGSYSFEYSIAVNHEKRIDDLEKKVYLVDGANNYNISKMFPNDNYNIYTLEEAVKLITSDMAYLGMVITFRLSLTSVKSYRLVGASGGENVPYYNLVSNYKEVYDYNEKEKDNLRQELTEIEKFIESVSDRCYQNEQTIGVVNGSVSNNDAMYIPMRLNSGERYTLSIRNAVVTGGIYVRLARIESSDSTSSSIGIINNGDIDIEFTVPSDFECNYLYIFPSVHGDYEFNYSISIGQERKLQKISSELDEANAKIESLDIRYVNLAKGGIYKNKELLFTKKDVNIGGEIFYSVNNAVGSEAFIELLDENNNRVGVHGLLSGKNNVSTYTGSFIVPQNFDKAVAGCYIPMTLNFLRKKETESLIGKELDDVEKNIASITSSVENRFANPYYETYEHYNENSTQKIKAEDVFYNGASQISNAGYRIPTIIVTNSNTVLVAAECRLNESETTEGGDSSDASIHVARKIEGSSEFEYINAFPFADRISSYGQLYNPSFVIDRTGAIEGVKGRIYLFAMSSKKKSSIWDETEDGGNLGYVYSDNDGLTWSEPVFLDRLFDKSQYLFAGSSPNNGLQMADGTLVVPCCCFTAEKKSRNLILYRKNGGDWMLSSLCPTDYIMSDECAIVEYEKTIVLSARNNYAKQGEVDEIWEYDFLKDAWRIMPSSFKQYVSCQFSLLNYNGIYLRSCPDSPSGKRENITIWVSEDMEHWAKCYRVVEVSALGYSVLAYYNNRLVIAYETGNGKKVAYQDVSILSNLLMNSVTFANPKLPLQDRLQLLFNKATNIQ